MVMALHEGHVVMSRPARGWGLLGGHREEGETPEECARREAMEEAAVELAELKLVGWWAAEKVFESKENENYPPKALQPLYISSVVKKHDFVPQLEIEERMFIPLEKVGEYHHAFSDFKPVYDYVVRTENLLDFLNGADSRA